MFNKNGFFRQNLAVGFLLFALFLGAGNIIFPPVLGQQAGENIFISILGFLITGVGLPLLAIVVVAKNGGDLQRGCRGRSYHEAWLCRYRDISGFPRSAL